MVLGPSQPIIDEVLSVVDLSDTSVRERLSPTAIKAFFAIMERWKVLDEEARALLGAITSEEYAALKNQPEGALDADTLTRISYLLGIYKALNILYDKNLADGWIRLPNSNPIFGGQRLITYMIKGGLPAMQAVRRLLDAAQEGA